MVGAGWNTRALICVGPDGETPIDLNAAAAENQEFLNTRKSERQEMVVLNDRLAVYIDKVRSLEQQNKLLEAEIKAYQDRFEKPTGLRLLYEEQLRELKKVAEQMKVQRDVSLAAKASSAAQLQAIKIKYEEAVELRRKAESDIEAFRPDVDKATSSRIILEKKLEQLEAEIEFLKRVHQQEIDELMKQIYSAHVSAQSALTVPDLATALKQIQTHYDDMAAKNLQDMDSWYKTKFEDLTNKTTRHVGKVRSIREEITGAKKDIQSKEHELDSLRARNEALEAQIREKQENCKKEVEELQARVEALQLELKSTKEKIALHLREYQDLLNAKMSLEIEITTYRKLVEGEDLRLSGMMGTLSLMGMSSIGAAISSAGGYSGSAGGTAGRNSGGGHERDGGTGGGSGTNESMGAGGAPGSSFGGKGENMNAGGLDKKKGPASGGAADAGGGLGAGGISGTESSHGGRAVGAGAGTGAEGKGIDGVGDAIGSSVASGSLGTNGGNDSVCSALGNGTAGGSGQSQRGSWVNGGAGGASGGYAGALSHTGGAETVGGRMDDTKGSECVSSGSSIDAYGDQAVEVTERRTVLIRTVKNKDDVLEMNHKERTYTINGAASND